MKMERVLAHSRAKARKLRETAPAPAPLPLPKLTAAQVLERALFMLRGHIASDQDKIDRFAAKILKDAFEALSWSNGMFEVAARLSVAKRILSALENHGNVVFVASYAKDEALRGARWPKQSTSLADRLASECQTAAWAEYAISLSELTLDLAGEDKP